MLIRRIVLAVVILALAVGCSSTDWQKKFVRTKEETVRPAQFTAEEDRRPYDLLYKEHFVYWRNWHRQLLEDLGKNQKRDRRNLLETRRHLEYLGKYLMEEQAKIAERLVAEFDKASKDLDRSHLSQSDYSLIGRRLENMLFKIQHELHYNKMTKFLLPTPVDLDEERYEGEEPVIPQAKESDSEPADKPLIDESEETDSESTTDAQKTLTYEQYRTLSTS